MQTCSQSPILHDVTFNKPAQQTNVDNENHQANDQVLLLTRQFISAIHKLFFFSFLCQVTLKLSPHSCLYSLQFFRKHAGHNIYRSDQETKQITICVFICINNLPASLQQSQAPICHRCSEASPCCREALLLILSSTQSWAPERANKTYTHNVH